MEFYIYSPIHPHGVVRRGSRSLHCDLSSVLAVTAVQNIYGTILMIKETRSLMSSTLHIVSEDYTSIIGTAVAQWLMCYATNRKVAGSIPAGVSGFFIDIKSFRSHYSPGVDSASNRNEYQEYFPGVKAAVA